MKADLPILFYDGYCNLCSGLVRFLIKRKGDEKFRFVPLHRAAEVLPSGMKVQSEPGTVVLFYKQQLHVRSDAVIRSCMIMGFPWNLAAFARIVPGFFRDGIYNFVARNRIRWFGRRKDCYYPGSDDRRH